MADSVTDRALAGALSPSAAACRARVVLVQLRARPGGVDDHTLIKTLQATPHSGVPGGSLLDPLTLFRCHWLTRNALYRLRERLWRRRCGHIDIGPLLTTLQPYRGGRDALAGHDPLRVEYLDECRLLTTVADDVVTLLGRFWTRADAAGARAGALAVLELDETADYQTVKQRYRRLAMRHHPDRGGCAETLLRVNDAMRTLNDYYTV